MTMQVPGVSAEEGRQLGQDVAKRVAERLPTNLTDRYLPSLDLRVALPQGAQRGEWAAIISESIVRQIMDANR